MTRDISKVTGALRSLFNKLRSTNVSPGPATHDVGVSIDMDAELRRYSSVGERVVSHAFTGLVLYGSLAVMIAIVGRVVDGSPGRLSAETSPSSMSMVDGTAALAVLVTVAIALQLVLATGGGGRPSGGFDSHGRLVAMADVARVTGFLSFVIAASVTVHGWPERFDVLGAVITFALAAVIASIAAAAELVWEDLERVERALQRHHKQSSIDRLRRAVAYWGVDGKTGQRADLVAQGSNAELRMSTPTSSANGGDGSADQIARSTDQWQERKSRPIRSGLGLLATCSLVPCLAWALANLSEQPSPKLADAMAYGLIISTSLLMLMAAAARNVALRQPFRALIWSVTLVMICIGVATNAATLWDRSPTDAIALQTAWLAPVTIGAASLSRWRQGFLRARVASALRAEIRRLQADEPPVPKKVTRTLQSKVRGWYAMASGVLIDDSSGRESRPVEDSSEGHSC